MEFFDQIRTIILHRSEDLGKKIGDTRLYEFLQQLRGGTKLVYPRREDSSRHTRLHIVHK